MSTEKDNKALIERWFRKVWNEGRAELIDELRSAETVTTGLADGKKPSHGQEPFKRFYMNLREAFPDLHVTVHDVLAEGDKVAVRFTVEATHSGPALGSPTKNKVHLDCMTLARIANGKIVESWNSLDQLGILKQIGALPAEYRMDFLISRSTS